MISLFTFATNLPKLKEDITRLGWTAAEAKITDTYVDTSDSSGAPEESVYCVVYEYTANSQPYYGTASDPDRAKKVGDSLEIRYNLESPPESFCTLNSYAKLWKTVALSGASGVVILIAMSIIDKSRKEKAKAEEE